MTGLGRLAVLKVSRRSQGFDVPVRKLHDPFNTRVLPWPPGKEPVDAV